MIAPPQFVGIAVGVMRQQVRPRGRDSSGLLAPLPRRAARIAERFHSFGGKVHHRIGQDARGEAEHRRGQDQPARIDLAFGDRAQHQVPAHRVPGEHMRAGGLRLPAAPQLAQILDPSGEIVDMASDLVGPEPPRPGLPAPVARGYLPAEARPVAQRFQILFVKVAAPGEEQDRAFGGRCRGGPVDPPDRPAIRRLPAAFTHAVCNRAALRDWLDC